MPQPEPEEEGTWCETHETHYTGPTCPGCRVREERLAKGAEQRAAARPPRGGGLTVDEVRRIASEVAERCITNRQHRMMRGFGMVPLVGRLDFVIKDGVVEARIDGHDIAKLLRITFQEGSRVSVLFADANVLEGAEPAMKPGHGTRQETYNPTPLARRQG